MAKIRRKGVNIRVYENTDKFANVAMWAATDFSDCGEDKVIYFVEQDDFPYIALHGDHIHILPRKEWRLADISESEAKDVLDRFKSWLKGKSIGIES